MFFVYSLSFSVPLFLSLSFTLFFNCSDVFLSLFCSLLPLSLFIPSSVSRSLPFIMCHIAIPSVWNTLCYLVCFCLFSLFVSTRIPDFLGFVGVHGVRHNVTGETQLAQLRLLLLHRLLLLLSLTARLYSTKRCPVLLWVSARRLCRCTTLNSRPRKSAAASSPSTRLP